MDDKLHILSTAVLDATLIDKAAASGIVVDGRAFTTVSYKADACLEQQIAEVCGQRANIVFTSAHSVRAVARFAHVGNMPWRIYCLAQATKDAVKKYFPALDIAGVANDAAELAQLIITEGVKEVCFFCGAQRMNTLPDALANAGVGMEEYVVYNTDEVHHKMNRSFNGVLFFSPSGVQSFFASNAVTPDAVLFAIGNTTAAAIREKSNNEVVVSTVASKAAVLNTAVQYFKEVAAAR